MSHSSNTSDESGGDAEHRQYPFGLSSYQVVFSVVLVGLLTPGYVVYFLESANLSGVADLVWVVGYGTTVFAVWFMWIRPLDLIGSSAHDASPAETDAAAASEAAAEGPNGKGAPHAGTASTPNAEQPDATADRPTEPDSSGDSE